MALSRIRKGTILIILIGIVGLFGDFTYEGARSIIPQYFTITLGGSVFLLGVVLGVSEFAGYAVRLFSGRLADRTRHYWTILFIGYGVNLFAVPLLAFTNNYVVAAVLIFLERFGRGTRTPSRDYIVSVAALSGKTGKAFAIEEALDQAGGVIGPLAVSLMLFYKLTYRSAFAFLVLPATAAMVVIVFAYVRYSSLILRRRQLAPVNIMSFRNFLIYSLAIAVSAAGLYQAAFVLYGAAQSNVATYLIPTIFVLAMLGEGVFGFLFGLLYDRIGRNLVYTGLLFSVLIPITLLGQGTVYLFLAALAFGIVTGIQDTVMRAVVGSMIEPRKRGYAFGIFNSFYGFGLMVSGIVVGYLFSSLTTIILYVILVQLIAFVLLRLSFKPREVNS